MSISSFTFSLTMVSGLLVYVCMRWTEATTNLSNTKSSIYLEFSLANFSAIVWCGTFEHKRIHCVCVCVCSVHLVLLQFFRLIHMPNVDVGVDVPHNTPFRYANANSRKYSSNDFFKFCLFVFLSPVSISSFLLLANPTQHCCSIHLQFFTLSV